MTYDLSPRTRDEIETVFPPRAVNYRAQYNEADAAYKLEVRMEAIRRIQARAVDAIADTHEHITARAGTDIALEYQLRRIQETVAFCTAELVARYMGRM